MTSDFVLWDAAQVGQVIGWPIFNLYSIFIPAHLIDRKKNRVSGFVTSCCSPPSTGGPVWTHEVVTSVSISKVIRYLS